MSETPFYPREKLVEKQKYFQSVHKYTHLKGPIDKITSTCFGSVSYLHDCQGDLQYVSWHWQEAMNGGFCAIIPRETPA